MASLIEITDGNFSDKVSKSSLPVLVVFWASWSQPCRQIMPLVEDLTSEFVGRAVLGRLDVDLNQSTCQSLGVRSLPTIIIFKGGSAVEQIVGAVPKSKIKEKLQKYA